MPVWPAQYDVFTLANKVTFDSLGLPTQGSLAKVTAEIAKHKKVPESSITLDYFKTSAAETAALYEYLKNADQTQRAGNAPWYKVTHLDCRDFCLNGLVESQVLSRWNANSLALSTPNTIIGDPMLPASLTYLGGTAVTSTIYSVNSTITYGSEVPASGQGQGDAGSGATPPDGGDGGDDGPPN